MQLLRSIFVLAATATALAIGAASTPTLADEYVTNLGAVGPNKPILATFSGQRFLAFFVHTFMWKDAGDTARVMLSLGSV